MYPTHRNAITAALTFTAEQYRQIQIRTRALADTALNATAAGAQANAERLIISVPHAESLSDADKHTLAFAITAAVRELSRQASLALQRGDLNNSALLEHRCRELYAAGDAVRGVPALPETPAPVGVDAEDQ